MENDDVELFLITDDHNHRYQKSTSDEEKDKHFAILITKGIRSKNGYRGYVKSNFNVIQFYIRKIKKYYSYYVNYIK